MQKQFDKYKDFIFQKKAGNSSNNSSESLS